MQKLKKLDVVINLWIKSTFDILRIYVFFSLNAEMYFLVGNISIEKLENMRCLVVNNFITVTENCTSLYNKQERITTTTKLPTQSFVKVLLRFPTGASRRPGLLFKTMKMKQYSRINILDYMSTNIF